MKRLDLTNKKFGRLVAVKYVGIKRKKAHWECVCVCGAKKNIEAYNLMHGTARSCGCLRTENRKEMNKTHGLTRTKFYIKWSSILNRCNNKNQQNYERYGGRGIKVEWDNFLEFKKDMYDSYLIHVVEHGEKNTTIDRIDVNKNYCKENCRWTTLIQQANNKRNTIYIEFKNKRVPLEIFAREMNINPRTLRTHYYRGNDIKV